MTHVKFVHWAARMSNSGKLCNNFRAVGTNGGLDFSVSLLAAGDLITWPCRMWPGSKELQLAKSLLGDEAQLAGCLRKLESCPLEWDLGIQ